MAEETNTIEFEFKGAKTLKQELREANNLLQQMVASGKATEEQIAAQTAKVAGLKDAIDDTNDAVGALTGAGKFQAFGKAIGAAAGGFSALSGAVALAGGESEDLQKTMVKLQAALAISQGLSQIEDLGNAFGNVKKVAAGAFDTVKNVGSKAFGSLKNAIISTGIGALVVALGALIANFDSVKKAVLNLIPGLSGVFDFFGKLTTAVTDFIGISSEEERQTERNIAARDKEIEGIDFQIQKAKLAGNEKKALALEEQKIIKQLANARDKYSQDRTAENAKEIRELKRALELKKLEQDKFDKEEADKAKQKSDEAAKKRKEDAARIKKEKEAADKAENDRQKSELKKQQDYQDELTLLQIENEDERTRKALELKQQRQREELDLEIKGYQDRQAKLTEEEKQTLASLQQTRIDLLKVQGAQTAELEDQLAQKKKDKDKEDLEKKISDAKDAADQIAANNQAALDKQYAQGLISTEEYEKQTEALEMKALEDKLKAIEKAGGETIEIENEIAAKRAELRAKDVEETKKTEEEKKAARTEALMEGFDFASSLTSQILSLEQASLEQKLNNDKLSEKEREKLAKESFEKQKKLQYALAVIDGAKAITAILSVPDFTLGIASGIRLAAAAASTAFTLATISKTEYSPSGGSGGGDSKPAGSKFAQGGLLQGPSHSMGGIKTNLGELEGGEFVMNRIASAQFLPTLEQMNQVGQAEAQLPAKQGQPIIKTYVVASEMSSQQEADKRISDLARL